MAEKKGANGWKKAVTGNVLALGLVSMFTDMSSEMIYPLLPVFFTGLMAPGAAAVYLGLMDGLAESVSAVMKIWSGRLSDRLGKRKLLTLVGYGFSTLMRPVMAFAGAGWQVVALRFGDRLGKGVRTAPRDALVADSVDAKHRGLAFSFHRAMDHVGAVLGSLLAMGLLYMILGRTVFQSTGLTASPEEMKAMRWLFAIAFLPGLAAVAVLALKAKEVRVKAAARAGNSGGKAGGLSPAFYVILSSVTLFALGNSSDLFLIFYGKTLFGFGLVPLISLWILLHLSKILFSIPGGVLSDRFGRRIMLILGWALYAVVYLSLAKVQSQAWFWALIMIYGAYYGLVEGAEKALVADTVESGRRGWAFGLYNGAVGLAALPASLLFGIFWARLGPQTAFAIGAALAGLASLLLLAGTVVCRKSFAK